MTRELSRSARRIQSALVAFLASERNSCISGTTIAIDGGATRGA